MDADEALACGSRLLAGFQRGARRFVDGIYDWPFFFLLLLPLLLALTLYYFRRHFMTHHKVAPSCLLERPLTATWNARRLGHSPSSNNNKTSFLLPPKRPSYSSTPSVLIPFINRVTGRVKRLSSNSTPTDRTRQTSFQVDLPFFLPPSIAGPRPSCRTC